MTKVKLLGLMVIILVAVNLLFLITFFKMKPNQPGSLMRDPDQPKKVIISRLHFNNEQITKYEKLITQHRFNIRRLDTDIRETKKKLYLTLTQSSTTEVDSLTTRLADIQKEIEMVHYNHFSDIKKLCSPDQMEYFNNLTQDLSRIFAREKNLPPPPKG